MENWTRSDRFAFYHLLVAILGLLAFVVVPGVQLTADSNRRNPGPATIISINASNTEDSRIQNGTPSSFDEAVRQVREDLRARRKQSRSMDSIDVLASGQKATPLTPEQREQRTLSSIARRLELRRLTLDEKQPGTVASIERRQRLRRMQEMSGNN